MKTVMSLSSCAVLMLAATAHAQTFTVDITKTAPWHHHWEGSVGSGHAALTTRSDWRAHLTRCAKELGVKRTRFHGLLDDDFNISLKEGQSDYTKLDSLVDFHNSIGMEPLFEVSFMPSWLANDTSQTVCHYKGITSPPTNFTKWGTIVKKMVAHLTQRYPKQVFMFEVWNEPNGGFWTPGDESDATKLKAYLELYKETSDSIKKASNSKYLVGGPALAGCNPEWVSALVDLETTNGTAVDFISCHAYGGGGNKNASGNIQGLGGGTTMNKFAKAGGKNRTTVMTEWSSSYSYNNGYHDDVASVPFIVAAAQKLQNIDITSYWTFSDVFEEGGLIPTPFHGGFGLLTIHGTPKPAYRAFQLLYGTGDVKYAVTKKVNVNAANAAAVTAAAACDTDAGVLVTSLAREGGTRVFLYNHPATFETVGANCTIALDGLPTGHASLVSIRHARIDDRHANPMAAWVTMGRPTHPTPGQLQALETASELVWESGGGLAYVVPPNGIVIVDVGK